MQEFLFEVLICFLAGAGAGLGTGFAGMSAATVISPMLVTFLGLPAYDAIGIALSSDVLASAVSARTYAKSGALDIKNGLVMMAGVLSMTMVGSWLSTFMPNNTLGGFSVVMTLILGLRFLLLPVTSPNRMLMCRKVTHKNLIDSNPLFPCNKEKAMYNLHLNDIILLGQSKGKIKVYAP